MHTRRGSIFRAAEKHCNAIIFARAIPGIEDGLEFDASRTKGDQHDRFERHPTWDETRSMNVPAPDLILGKTSAASPPAVRHASGRCRFFFGLIRQRETACVGWKGLSPRTGSALKKAFTKRVLSSTRNPQFKLSLHGRWRETSLNRPRGDADMHDDWTPTTSGLPREGNVVEFVLDTRFHPIRGTYLLGHFESRWAKYAPPNVRQWRTAPPASAAMPPRCPPWDARFVVSVK